MENPHKDQLKIKSSKLYQITSIKEAMKQMDLRTMQHSFWKNWTNHVYWEQNNLKRSNLKNILFCKFV